MGESTEPSNVGACKLCLQQKVLQQSHVVPAFVFRWLKKTSPTPYMRNTRLPNRRVQDGEKRLWLCRDCEQLFGNWETLFAENIFYKFCADPGQKLPYGDWLLKFCTSLSWRTLMLYKTERAFTHLTPNQQDEILPALENWRRFLFGDVSNPSKYRQELLPLDLIQDHRGALELAPQINQYLTRAIEVDVIAGKHSAYTLTKIGRFLVFGHLCVERPKIWEGTQVRLKSGWVQPSSYGVPSAILEHINHKAQVYGTALEKLSPEQKAKVGEAFEANFDKVKGSDWWRATKRDLEMQGFVFDEET